MDAPYNFNDRSEALVVYESANIISSITRCEEENLRSYYIICDEDKILKVMELVRYSINRKKAYRLEVRKEYFVHNTFNADIPFTYSNRMVYHKFKAVVCQLKGTDKS